LLLVVPEHQIVAREILNVILQLPGGASGLHGVLTRGLRQGSTAGFDCGHVRCLTGSRASNAARVRVAPTQGAGSRLLWELTGSDLKNRQSTRRKFFSQNTSVTLRVPKTSLSNFDRSSGAPFHAARRRTSTKTSTSKQTVEHLKGSRSRRARQSAARKQSEFNSPPMGWQ
jgi:hypothetical protein